MPRYNEKHVMVKKATIIWDGMTRPDTNESGVKHHFKVVLPPNHPDARELEALAQEALNESAFKGVLPATGTMPVAVLGPQEHGGLFPGWSVFTAGTYKGWPDVYDENGQAIDAMQAGPQIYTGQVVDLLVHCYVNNGKVKGVACGLDAFAIIQSAQAPRLNLGAGPRVDTAAAFGGGASAGQQYQQPVQGQPAQGQPAQGQYQQPVQGQPAQGQHQQPVQGQPAQGQPAQGQYQQPVQGQPAQGQYQQPVQGQYPAQAHNFLPGGQQ